MPAPRSAAPHYEIAAGRVFFRVPERLEVLRPWGPAMGAREWRPTHGWRPFEPGLSLAKLENTAAVPRAEGKAAAARFILESWPASAREAVRPLPGVYHWLLMLHLNFCGQVFEDLLLSHPPLALALALRRKLTPWDRSLEPFERAAHLAHERRRRIAAALLFPDSERTVRLLGRIPLAALSVDALRQLRQAMNASEEVNERLSYLPSVNALAGAILSDPHLRPLVSQPCLAAVAQWTDPDASSRFLARLRRTAHLAVLLDRRPAPIEDPAQIEILYRHLLADTPSELLHPADPDAFGPPPIPEIENIRAIRLSRDLVAEGREMHHCAASYTARVRRGDAYFYRMISPERATICMAPGRYGWDLEEARGISNRPIQAKTLAVVEAWLRTHLPRPRERECGMDRLPAYVAPPPLPPPPRPVFGEPRRRVRRPRCRAHPDQLAFEF